MAVDVPDLNDYVMKLKLATLKTAYEKLLENVLPSCR